jgi:hypothetical protein
MASLLAVEPSYKQTNEKFIAEDLAFLSDFDLHKLCTDYEVFDFYSKLLLAQNYF